MKSEVFDKIGSASQGLPAQQQQLLAPEAVTSRAAGDILGTGGGGLGQPERVE